MKIRWFKQHNVVHGSCEFTSRPRKPHIETEMVLQVFDDKDKLWKDVEVEENMDGLNKADQEIVEWGEQE